VLRFERRVSGFRSVFAEGEDDAVFGTRECDKQSVAFKARRVDATAASQNAFLRGYTASCSCSVATKADKPWSRDSSIIM
jgi:predicted trehalose synthase